MGSSQRFNYRAKQAKKLSGKLQRIYEWASKLPASISNPLCAKLANARNLATILESNLSLDSKE